MKKYAQLFDSFEKILNAVLTIYFVFSIGVFLLCAFLGLISPIGYLLNNPDTYSKDKLDILTDATSYLWDGMAVPLHNLLLGFRNVVHGTVFVFSLLKMSEKPQFRKLMLFEVCYFAVLAGILLSPDYFIEAFAYINASLELLRLFAIRDLIFILPFFLLVVALRLSKDFFQRIKAKKT